MFFVSVFVISWLVFLLFAHKTNFKQLYPTALVAMIMSLSSDIVVRFIPFWRYHDLSHMIPKLLLVFLDDFGLYPVIAYLFVQWLPKTIGKWFMYTFVWTIAGTGMEYFMILKGYMEYQSGWTLMHSFIADWIIFAILSSHYVWFVRKSRPIFMLKSENKAHIAFDAVIEELTRSHLLSAINNLQGVKIYQGVSTNTVESFVMLLDPKADFPPHRHEGYEIHYVVDGKVSILLEGREIALNEGDIYSFSSDTPHSFNNVGTEQAKLITILVTDELLQVPREQDSLLYAQ